MDHAYIKCNEGAEQMITESTEMLKRVLDQYHFKLTK